MSALRCSLLGLVVWMAFVPVTAFWQSRPPATVPRLLEQYLATTIRPSGGERKQLLEGSPIAKILDGDASREIGVFGAVWVNAPRSRYVEALRDIERFERGTAFRVTRRISTPPRAEDFADLRFPDRDIDDLKKCRVGDCNIKLDEATIESLRTVDWTKGTARADANRIFQQFAFNYVTAYLEKGNGQLAVYRDRSRPVQVSAELAPLVERVPLVSGAAPDLRRYLLEFPGARRPQSTDFLYWQETEFGLKPTIRFSHVTTLEGAQDTVVASKMLYATHYFWTALEFRVLIPDPARGEGFWFVNVNRSRSDGLSGLIGLFVRGRARGRVRDGLLSALKATKARLEGPVSLAPDVPAR